MSLATRCPVCRTVFRVVQDQLKVSEGWVRCGRCAKVFNAFEGLFDLEREFPALRSPTPSQRVLEDLATRNRQPKPPASWSEPFDTESGVRGASHTVPPAPTSPAATTAGSVATHVIAPPAVPQRAASAVPPVSPPPMAAAAIATTTAPHAIAQRSLGAPQPSPAPATPAGPATSSGMPMSSPSATVHRETSPLVSRATRAPLAQGQDEGVTIPPAAVVAGTQATVVSAPDRSAASAAQAPMATTAPAAAPLQPTAKSAARANLEIAIRDEPAPVPGTGAEPDAASQEESFEALFRSDGELANTTAADDDGVDIRLDGNDVEPASLDPDDAVDSRLLTFVQQAERAERWRRPWVRAALTLSALALTVLLAVQLLVAQRDLVVAQWPGSRSLVQSLCAPLGCRIEPLRRIDQLGVDSSGLTRIDDGPVYRLVLVLRNRSDTPLLMPSIDLSLTDAAGVLVARRMLSAADLGTARSTIGAGQELPLQALLMSSERALTGYTIEIFYP